MLSIKILSTILTVVLIISTVIVPVYADEADNVQYQEIDPDSEVMMETSDESEEIYEEEM